jgi:4-hydroxy-tetrahydrodipicolinate reductase
MDIALIGYGAMGKLVHRQAEAAGNHITVIVNESHGGLAAEHLAETLRTADLAIDFSVAEAVPRNVAACMAARIPVVEGTTGWMSNFEAVKESVINSGGAMIYGSNFSIGVNLFYRVAEFACELFARFPEYEAFIEEQHHSRKKDSPSGTALKLRSIAEKYVSIGEIAATRAGNIPGTHRIGFDGPTDQCIIEHTARNREGFAAGAITAAQWILGKPSGFYEFNDIISEDAVK